jgi:hypothetical protein
MVDTLVLGTSAAMRVGSSPTLGTLVILKDCWTERYNTQQKFGVANRTGNW